MTGRSTTMARAPAGWELSLVDLDGTKEHRRSSGALHRKPSAVVGCGGRDLGRTSATSGTVRARDSAFTETPIAISQYFANDCCSLPGHQVSSQGSVELRSNFGANTTQTGPKTKQGQLPEDEARQHYPQP